MSRLGKYFLNEAVNPMRIILRLSILWQLFYLLQKNNADVMAAYQKVHDGDKK